MTHIDIARAIRYRLLAELHKAAGDLYGQQVFGAEPEIRAVVAGFDAAICSFYAHYTVPPTRDSRIEDTGGKTIGDSLSPAASAAD
jgi:hypothetical protein